MNTTLLLAIVTITLAFIFYTLGVFSERKANILQKKHLLLFWVGLLFDTTGTMIMSSIANNHVNASSSYQSLHAITGVLAIVLMLLHAVWATFILYKGNEKQKHFFHRFSLSVWIIWLFPYVIGMFIGMAG